MGMGQFAVLAGLGAWLPPRVVDNAELARSLDTSDEWIRARTGIQARHIAGPDTSTVDMAVRAGENALSSAGSDAVDALVLATAGLNRLNGDYFLISGFGATAFFIGVRGPLRVTRPSE